MSDGASGAAPFLLRPFTEDDARALVGWRYDGPYAFYDPAAEDLPAILAELPAYAAAEDGWGALAGFFVFGAGARVPGGERAGLYPPGALDVGLGLRPDLVGRGLGAGFVAAGLAYVRGRVAPPPARFRLSVAAWNLRAVRAYERAGFRPGPRFTSPVRGKETAFLLMTTPPAADAGGPILCTIGRDQDSRPAPLPGEPPPGALGSGRPLSDEEPGPAIGR